METIKLNGFLDEKNLITRVLREKPETIFILNSKKEIFKFIEEIKLDGLYQYNFKIAKEVFFPPNSILKSKSEKKIIKKDINCLSDVLSAINIENMSDLRLVLDTEKKLASENEKEALIEIIQQFIYLNIDLDVLLYKEEQQKLTIDVFLDNLPQLIDTVNDALKGAQAVECIFR
jgi:hypothetical protein